MRITCPACTAEYDLGMTLAAGRVVRCARCGSEWAPVPAEPPPRIVEVAPPQQPFRAAPADDRVDEPPEPTPDTPADTQPAATARNAGLAVAWIASAALIVALLAAGYVFRAPIMQAWPPSTRLYAALGLA